MKNFFNFVAKNLKNLLNKHDIGVSYIYTGIYIDMDEEIVVAIA